MGEQRAPTSVAVIGVGAMGAPIALRLLARGFAVAVCDPREAATAPLAAAGATVCPRPRDCAACDAMLLLVATADQARAALFSQDGLVAGVADGATPVVALMSTIDPPSLRAIAADLARRGVRTVDAPISGGAARAAAGTLTILAGGDAADIETLRPVLDSIGERLIHCGDVGAGQATKIVNNLVCIASTLATAEAYRLASDYGLDPDVTTQALEAGTGRTYLTRDPGGPPAFYAAIARDRPTFDAIIAILRKDIGLAAALAGSTRGQFPFIAALEEALARAGDDAFRLWSDVGASVGAQRESLS